MRSGHIFVQFDNTFQAFQPFVGFLVLYLSLFMIRQSGKGLFISLPGMLLQHPQNNPFWCDRNCAVYNQSLFGLRRERSKTACPRVMAEIQIGRVLHRQHQPLSYEPLARGSHVTPQDFLMLVGRVIKEPVGGF